MKIDKMQLGHNFRYLLPNTLLLVLAGILLLTYQGWARSPQSVSRVGSQTANRVISYQGTLTNDLGQPIHESLPMTFRLYDSPEAVDALWTEIYTSTNAIQVQNGQFQVWLGSETPFPSQLWDTATLYLGIQIDTDAEMLPRERLGATAFSMKADSASAVADRSIESAKLALQQQVQKLDSATPISVTAIVSQGIGSEISATALLVNLQKPSRILYTAQAIATYSNAEALQTIQVVVDGSPVHQYQSAGQRLNTIGIFTYIDLPAGSHRIVLHYLSSDTTSQLLIADSPTPGFVSYLVLDQQ